MYRGFVLSFKPQILAWKAASAHRNALERLKFKMVGTACWEAVPALKSGATIHSALFSVFKEAHTEALPLTCWEWVGQLQSIPNLFSPRDCFWGRLFFPQPGSKRWFGDNSGALHLLCTLFLLMLHQLQLRSSGIRSERLGTLAVELANSHLFFPWSKLNLSIVSELKWERLIVSKDTGPGRCLLEPDRNR